MHLVFVYGTLKRGEPNAHVMSNETTGYSHFIGAARMLVKHPLIVSTQFNIPFLLKDPGVGHLVEGEIFEVDDGKLVALDTLENHPHFYVRTQHQVQMLEKDEQAEVWIYLLPEWKESLIASASEMLVSYSTNGEHNRKYVERYLLDQQVEADKHTLIAEVRA